MSSQQKCNDGLLTGRIRFTFAARAALECTHQRAFVLVGNDAGAVRRCRGHTESNRGYHYHAAIASLRYFSSEREGTDYLQILIGGPDTLLNCLERRATNGNLTVLANSTKAIGMVRETQRYEQLVIDLGLDQYWREHEWPSFTDHWAMPILYVRTLRYSCSTPSQTLCLLVLRGYLPFYQNPERLKRRT